MIIEKKTECNCLGMYKAVSGPHFIATVHNDWSLWSFSYADLATLQYQATRQGQRPSDFWFGCYVDQFKPQLLLMEKKLSLCWSSFKSMEKTQQQTIPMDKTANRQSE
jgi:hypothetical protein